MILWNYGDEGEMPWLQCDFDEDWDEVAAAQRDSTLLAAGVALPKAWFYERHGIPMPGDGDEVIGGTMPEPETGETEVDEGDGSKPPVRAKAARVRRKDPREASREATARIGLEVAERLTGVSRAWLGPVIPVFAHLVGLAQDGEVSDADFEAAIVRAAEALPELAPYMDADALQQAMEEAMAPALINGAWAGERRGKA
jgi:phage gp29-like protein